MVKMENIKGQAPNLTAEEIERLVTLISRGHIGEDDVYVGNFLLLLDALAEEEHIDDRREYVLAAQRALVHYTHAFFTTSDALRQLSLETLRGDVGRVTVERKPKTRRARGK